MAFKDEVSQLLSQMPFTLALPLTAFIAWRLWRFTLMPLFYPKEPKVLPYWIPGMEHITFGNG